MEHTTDAHHHGSSDPCHMVVRAVIVRVVHVVCLVLTSSNDCPNRLMMLSPHVESRHCAAREHSVSNRDTYFHLHTGTGGGGMVSDLTQHNQDIMCLSLSMPRPTPPPPSPPPQHMHWRTRLTMYRWCCEPRVRGTDT